MAMQRFFSSTRQKIELIFFNHSEIHLVLVEDLRIDLEEHKNWDLEIIRLCIETGRKRRELRFLFNVIQNG